MSERHIYCDLSNKPHFFDPDECERHPFEPLGMTGPYRDGEQPFQQVVFMRLPGTAGAWIGADVAPAWSAEVGVSVAAALKCTLVRWQQKELSQVVDYFRAMDADFPASLVSDIEAQQASASAPGEGTSKPSAELLTSIVSALRGVLDASALCRRHHQSPLAETKAMRLLFDALGRLNDSLGRVPHGDDEIRNPSGWPIDVQLTLMNLGSDLEALIGNDSGRWGLRGWQEVLDKKGAKVGAKAASEMRWPSFGDMRYQPFSFGGSQVSAIERMQHALSVLEPPQAAVSDPRDGTADPAPSKENAPEAPEAPVSGPGEETSKPPTPAKEDTPEGDPIQQAVDKLVRSKRKVELIRFLAARDKREAELRDIVTGVYIRKAVNDENLRLARKQAERTRDALEDERCPVRIDISMNTVRLIDAQPVA